MTTNMNVYGARVRQARVLRKLTAKAVVAELGWSAARLTRLEQATETELSADDMTALTRVLRFPARFFQSAPVTRVHESDLLFRAPKSTTKTEKEYLAQYAAVAGEFLDELHSRWRLPAVKVPLVDPQTSIVSAAGQARDALGLRRDEPITYLTHSIEQAGVPILVRRMLSSSSTARVGEDSSGTTDKHLGYSTRVGDFKSRPVIVVRQSPSWERTRWTLAHELGHLVLHSGGEVTEDKEEQASRFASELLAPIEQVSKEVSATPSLMALLPVKKKWGISLAALLRHLHTSELLTEDRFRSLQKQLYQRINPQTGLRWGKTEPGWDERIIEQPRMLSKWIELAFHSTSTQALATFDLIWPPDLLAEFVVGQREAPSPHNPPSTPTRAGATPGSSSVIDFSKYQRSRQA